MYVEAKPLSTYGGTAGWKMPSPSSSAAGALKRPGILKNGSSSSLSGMEQSIPSFKSFVKRAPPPDAHKPLPPTPLEPRRASSFSQSSPRPSISSLSRRSSSIYSRTASQWGPTGDGDAWQRADPGNRDDMLLRPLAYSASTSQLVSSQPPPLPVPQILEPRAYDPLLPSPPVTTAGMRTPSPKSPGSRPSVLLPPPPASVKIPTKHLRTVSLEKANASVNAPGAEHLLPEELRAKTFGKSRSQEPLRVSSMAIFVGDTPMSSPTVPTLVDSAGRERVVHFSQPPTSPPIMQSSSLPSTEVFPRGGSPLQSQARKESRAKAAQALGLEDEEEEVRGRQMTRGPRNMSYDHYLPKGPRISDSSNDEQTASQKIAQEYHDMLSQQYRAFAESPASHRTARTESSGEVKAEMRMVPQPLFHGRPSVQQGPTADGTDSRERIDSGVGSSFMRRSNSGRSSLLSRLTTSSSRHRRASTSGSIPISPPSDSLPTISQFWPTSPDTPVVKPRPDARLRSQKTAPRESAYYPHVMSRRKKSKPRNGRKKTSKVPESDQAAALPMMLAADIIAERDSTEEPLPPAPEDLEDSTHGLEKTDSVDSSKPFHRVLKGAAKYKDLFSSASTHPHDDTPSTPVATPDSPHLLPSPTSSTSKDPPGFHLGWSDYAKTTFDKARSSVQPSARDKSPQVMHHITPARPLDESKAGLVGEEPEMGTRRRGSVFATVMDGWRESKAQKRREELKKMIKVVTPGSEGQG